MLWCGNIGESWESANFLIFLNLNFLKVFWKVNYMWVYFCYNSQNQKLNFHMLHWWLQLFSTFCALSLHFNIYILKVIASTISIGLYNTKSDKDVGSLQNKILLWWKVGHSKNLAYLSEPHQWATVLKCKSTKNTKFIWLQVSDVKNCQVYYWVYTRRTLSLCTTEILVHACSLLSFSQ